MNPEAESFSLIFHLRKLREHLLIFFFLFFQVFQFLVHFSLQIGMDNFHQFVLFVFFPQLLYVLSISFVPWLQHVQHHQLILISQLLGFYD